MASLSGGVTTNTTTGSPSTTLGGGLTLSGLANLFPGEVGGATYNVPIQNNTANQLVFPTAAAKADPFASSGLSQAPLLAQNSTGVQSPFAGQSQDYGMAPLLEAQDPGAPTELQLNKPQVAPITLNKPQVPDNIDLKQVSPGGATVSAPPAQDVDSPDGRLARLEKNLEQMQEAFYNASPSQPQPVQGGSPVIVNQPGVAGQPPSAAPVAPAQPTAPYMPYTNMQQNMPWWKRAALNYNMARHPHIANYMQAQMAQQRALEVARINAAAQYEKERLQQDRQDARAQAELGSKEKIAGWDNAAKENIARIGQGLTAAQKIGQIGDFIKLPPGSDGRKQMAALNPDLQAHINDPQDPKAAAEYANTSLQMQKNIIENTVADATMGANIKQKIADAKKAGIDAEAEYAAFEANLQKKIADANKAMVGARVAQATESADINQAQQNAYAAYVDNQYRAPLKGQAILGNNIDMAAKQIEAAMNLPNAAIGADMKRVQAVQQNLSKGAVNMLQGQGMMVPPPPNTGPAMSASFRQMPPPPVVPGGAQQAAPGFLPPPPALVPMNLPSWMPNPYMQGGMVAPPPPLPGMPQGQMPAQAPAPQMMPPQMVPSAPQSQPPAMAGGVNVGAQAAPPPQLPMNQPRTNPVDENLRKAQLIATQLPGSIAKGVIAAAPGAIASIPGNIYNGLKSIADAGDKMIGDAREAGFQRELKGAITEFMRPASRGLPDGAPLTDPDLLSQFAINSHGNQRWYKQLVAAAGWGQVVPSNQPQPLTQAMQDKYSFERFGAQLTADPEAYRKYRAEKEVKQQEEARRRSTLGGLTRPAAQMNAEGY